MSEIIILPIEVEKSIEKFIKRKFEQDNLAVSFPNALLREDVLDLLDRYCTVVYYPLENEENNGFRLKEIPFADGSRHDFVFINTAQTMEKQVFTAAHELGHIWNVDEFVVKDLGLQETVDLREHIINRFAAVLLVPSDSFSASVRVGLQELGDRDKKAITYVNLLKMIVILMNQFFAPMKAIVLRLVELKFFRQEIADVFFGYESIPAEEFTNRISELIVEFGYTKLQNPSNKKWIEGLAEKLDIAEENNLVSQNKIKVMREKFGLKPASSTMPGLNDVVSLDTQEGQEE